MTNGEFLKWIHLRMVEIHGENPNYDYMHKLLKISNVIDAYEQRIGHADNVCNWHFTPPNNIWETECGNKFSSHRNDTPYFCICGKLIFNKKDK